MFTEISNHSPETQKMVLDSILPELDNIPTMFAFTNIDTGLHNDLAYDDAVDMATDTPY